MRLCGDKIARIWIRVGKTTRLKLTEKLSKMLNGKLQDFITITRTHFYSVTMRHPKIDIGFYQLRIDKSMITVPGERGKLWPFI